MAVQGALILFYREKGDIIVELYDQLAYSL